MRCSVSRVYNLHKYIFVFALSRFYNRSNLRNAIIGVVWDNAAPLPVVVINDWYVTKTAIYILLLIVPMFRYSECIYK